MWGDESQTGAAGFDELAGLLLEQGTDASPSTCHGALAGILCAGGPGTEAASEEYALHALSQALQVSLYGELASQLMQLYTATAAALADDELGFHPLLPDDDVELALRAAALADWCQGYLAGFAQAAAAAESARPLSPDSSEVLADIRAMADAVVGEDADDFAEDDAEQSLFELVEYLRLAVISVFGERETAT